MEKKQRRVDAVFRNGVQVISKEHLPYERFETEFLEARIPVIISGCMTEWPCYKEWTVEGGSGQDTIKSINLEFLAHVFGDVRVPVIHMNSGERSSILMREYCSETFWKSGMWNDTQEKLYIKDFHFCIDAPASQNVYKTPIYFEDDWLNTWFDGDEGGILDTFGTDFKKSDYRFLYLGPRGSSTPLHTDVVRSHSWSAQIAGRKQWCLLDPKYSKNIEDHNGICRYNTLTESNNPVFTINQYPGEIIFVPSGWYHEVVNIDDSLSINHNWIDSSSLETSWKYLMKEYDIAAFMIEDCKELTSTEEFEVLVDRNVLHNCGFHRKSFLKMVQFVLNCSLCSSSRLAKRRQKHGEDFMQKCVNIL